MNVPVPTAARTHHLRASEVAAELDVDVTSTYVNANVTSTWSASAT
jgi:hypothetical protein